MMKSGKLEKRLGKPIAYLPQRLLCAKSPQGAKIVNERGRAETLSPLLVGARPARALHQGGVGPCHWNQRMKAERVERALASAFAGGGRKCAPPIYCQAYQLKLAPMRALADDLPDVVAATPADTMVRRVSVRVTRRLKLKPIAVCPL